MRWTPAALVGGLVFGFSPFVVVNLAGAHLMTGVLVFLPLIVACLDELLLRQRHRPIVVGAALGLLLTAQFFLGTEVLTMVMLTMVAALVLLAAYGALGHRAELAARWPHAWRGLAATAVVAAVLLAYPVWFALAGPAHLSGLVWPTITPGSGGITFSHLVRPSYMTSLRNAMQVTGGYEGPALLQPEYLGPGLLVVLVAGVLWWRRDRRLWLFGSLGLLAVVASLGNQRYWTPWRVLNHVPVVQNILTGRFAIITSLCAAIMLAIVIDRTRDGVRAWASARAAARPARPGSRRRGWAGVLGAGAALVVAALAVVPVGAALASNTPLTTEAVTLPAWFADVAPHLGPDQVVLTYPPPAIGASTLAWQAVDRLHYAMATGAGPQSILARAGRARAGQAVIDAEAFSFSPPAALTEARLDAVRHALIDWGVTVVAVTDPTTLVAPFGQLDNTAWALALFTAALGRPPAFVGDTWVWTGVSAQEFDHAPDIATATLSGCVSTGSFSAGSRLDIPTCVLEGRSG